MTHGTATSFNLVDMLDGKGPNVGNKHKMIK
jgi:hypothetical protein